MTPRVLTRSQPYGRVLVAGGSDVFATPFASAEVLDTNTGLFTASGQWLNQPFGKLEQEGPHLRPDVGTVGRYELSQRLPVDELESDERNSVANSVAEHLHDMWRGNPSRNFDLVLETKPVGVVIYEGVPQ